MQPYIWWIIGIAVLVVYGLNYLCFLRRRARNLALLKNPEQITCLTFFEDSNNYVGWDFSSQKPDLLPDKGFLPFWLFPWWLYFSRIVIVLYWKIDGRKGYAGIDLPPSYNVTYNSKIDRIVQPTHRYVYLIDPFNGKKEKIKTGIKKRFAGGCISDDADHVFLVGPMIHKRGEKREYYCADIDITLRKCSTFDLPDLSWQILFAEDNSCLVVSKKKLYKIKDSKTEIVREFEYETSCIGKWPGDNLIFEYNENDLPRLSWDDVVIQFSHPVQHIQKAGEFVWAVDFDGKQYVLKAFAVSGQSTIINGLKEKPRQIGNWQDKGVWLAYADGSVEVYDKNGEHVVNTQLDFKLGMKLDL